MKVLKNTNVPKKRPRTKHIAINYHYICSAIKSRIILVTIVDTKKQLVNIFPTFLAKQTFKYLRSKINGWIEILSKIFKT